MSLSRLLLNWFLPFKIKCPSDRLKYYSDTRHQHSYQYCVLIRSPESLAKLYSSLNDRDLECQFKFSEVLSLSMYTGNQNIMYHKDYCWKRLRRDKCYANIL